ncbi:Kae1-associated serine/threonine protein kinase [Candidatus Woesearchaeota archaeon]|nr:Kae1-associated serine/threonine protein kinase [Candidatus Woesearchaeota archaeon]
MELIAQGAEAKLYRDGEEIIKERTSKSYRVPELDKALRQFRTRREAKVLSKLAEIEVLCPALRSMSDKEMKIKMSFVAGAKLKDVIAEDVMGYGRELGELISKMHAADIVHYDLTTSNMIVKDKIYLIDFGLSFFSCKPEDKAVDLRLFKRALESAHHEIFERVWNAFLSAYEHDDVLKRLEVVDKRGRHK